MSLSRYLSIGSALLVAMILTRLLDEDVYGSYRKLWLIYAILGPVLISSITNTLYYRGNGANRDESIVVNLLLGLLYGIGIGGIAWLLAPFWATQLNIPELADGFRMFAPYMVFAVFAGIAEPLFVVLNRKKWLIGYGIGYNTLESALIVVPFAVGMEIKDVVLIMSIGPAIRSLCVIFISFSQIKKWPDWGSIRKEFPVSFKYGLGIITLSIAGIAATEADKWVIGSFFESDALFAIYVIGAKKIPFITALTAVVSATIVSEFAEKLRIGSVAEAMTEARKASSRLSLIIIPLVVWLFIYAEEVMILLFGKYEASAPVFRVYILTVLSQLIFPQSIALGAGRSDVNAKAGILEVLINISLSIMLVMWIGFIGPAIATLVSHFFFTGLMLWFCKRTYNIKVKEFMPDKRISVLLWILPVVLLLGVLLKYVQDWNWIGFIMTGVVAGVLIALALKKSGFR